jgi:hypothetical protein
MQRGSPSTSIAEGDIDKPRAFCGVQWICDTNNCSAWNMLQTHGPESQVLAANAIQKSPVPCDGCSIHSIPVNHPAAVAGVLFPSCFRKGGKHVSLALAVLLRRGARRRGIRAMGAKRLSRSDSK